MQFQILSVSLLAGLASALPCGAPVSEGSANSTLPIESPSNTTRPIDSPSGGGNGGAAAGGLVGYGEKTTGGAGGAEVTVTSCATLKTAVTGTGAKIVNIQGVLDGCGIIDIDSNTSVL